MRESTSHFWQIRRLRYHVRHWPGDPARRVVMLHGWMDVSASFQFVVDALGESWDVHAPDWRGYGESEWGPDDCYWFPDYIADLDALLARLSPDAPVNLLGHSLGGNVAALYAGIRPQRVAKLVNLEGFGMAPTRPETAPSRYARWMDELAQPPTLRPYANFGVLAERLRRTNPRLTAERADFLARHWGRETETGEVVLRSDPAHKVTYPIQYRYEESRACWAAVTAPVLWVDTTGTDLFKRAGITPESHAERRAAFANLRYATVQDAGHMLHHDQPEAVAQLIAEFLAAA